MKGHIRMNKHKFAKFAVKAAVGAVGSAAIGYLIKGEKLTNLKIDEYFDKLKPTTED
jgi:hypothetical protein